MKLPELSDEERLTLREMGIFHPHPRTRMRATPQSTKVRKWKSIGVGG